MKRTISFALAAILVSQLTACGTILYPDRRDQEAGRIDPAVAVLDGVGLLFFLVPGVIAYGVDFATGAIYLPDSETAAIDRIPLPHKGPISADEIERTVEAHTGKHIQVQDSMLVTRRMQDRDQLMAALHRFSAGQQLAYADPSPAPGQ